MIIDEALKGIGLKLEEPIQVQWGPWKDFKQLDNNMIRSLFWKDGPGGWCGGGWLKWESEGTSVIVPEAWAGAADGNGHERTNSGEVSEVVPLIWRGQKDVSAQVKTRTQIHLFFQPLSNDVFTVCVVLRTQMWRSPIPARGVSHSGGEESLGQIIRV